MRERVMNWDQVKGKWQQVKGQVRAKWGKLTDDDLDRIEGRREELVGRIRERYGYQKDQVEKDVDDWMKTI
jgi:uncharacterized protein YjbJ (UPF0337 family)